MVNPLASYLFLHQIPVPPRPRLHLPSWLDPEPSGDKDRYSEILHCALQISLAWSSSPILYRVCAMQCVLCMSPRWVAEHWTVELQTKFWEDFTITKVLVSAFNKEKALVRAFSVIVKANLGLQLYLSSDPCRSLPLVTVWPPCWCVQAAAGCGDVGHCRTAASCSIAAPTRYNVPTQPFL